MISILIGRDREQQRSLELLDDSQLSAGARRLIQLDGAMGVGKSSLLAYALAHRSDPLFLIHGDRFTAEGPLVAHRTMIEQLLGQDLESLLNESTPQLLAVRCANALGTAPVLIAVDDAQWLDPASEEFLTQLMLSPATAPLTILLVHRREYEPATIISAARRRGAIHEHFTLPELPDVAITELVDGLQPTQIRAVVEAAEGNPLFARAARAGFQRHPNATRIDEVLRLEHNSQSSVLNAVITDDVTTVSDPARTVLQTMAILGPSSDEATLRAVAELDDKTYDDAVEELTIRGLIDLSAHENMHPVVRYSAYQNTDSEWLIQAHRRAAHYFQDEMLTKAEHLAHIAGHLSAAEAAHLVEAAGLVIGSEPHIALRWLSDIPAQYRDETAELLLARAETLNGQHQQAAQRLRSLQRRLDTDEVRIQLANVLRISGEYEEARALLSTRGSTRDGKVMREALDVYGLLDGRAPERLVRELVALPGDENRISAATYRTMDYLSDGKVPEARGSFAGVSTWMLAAEMQTLRPMLHAVACAVWCAYMLDEFANGAAIAARGLKIARRFGQADVVADLGAGLAFNQVQLAHFPEVEDTASQAVHDAQRYGPVGVEAMARAALLTAAQANPDREVLRQRYAELKATPIPEFSWWRRAVLTTLTRVSALLGEPQPAPDLLTEPHDVMAPLRHADAALVAAVTGNIDVAFSLLKDGIAIAQRQDSQGQRAMLEVTQAEILLNTGDVVESAKLFTSAQDVFQRLGMALQIGRARAGLASIEHQRKQQPDPLQHLTKREREIAQLVAQGLTNQNIAEHLTISRRTVENHTANIMRKLGAASRHGIVAQLHGENG